MSNRTFDATKRYQWQPTDKIVFNGSEFEAVHRALSTFVAGDVTKVSTVLRLAEAFSVVQNKLSEYVENGIFTEYVEPITTE